LKEIVNSLLLSEDLSQSDHTTPVIVYKFRDVTSPQPTEIIFKIMDLLDDWSICQFTSVQKRWSVLFLDENFWETRLFREHVKYCQKMNSLHGTFGIMEIPLTCIEEAGGFFKFYQQRCHFLYNLQKLKTF
jgi:hypothetical protein